jgi:hypothetical protein
LAQLEARVLGHAEVQKYGVWLVLEGKGQPLPWIASVHDLVGIPESKPHQAPQCFVVVNKK